MPVDLCLYGGRGEVGRRPFQVRGVETISLTLIAVAHKANSFKGGLPGCKGFTIYSYGIFYKIG